jgi:hypothetical protein
MSSVVFLLRLNLFCGSLKKTQIGVKFINFMENSNKIKGDQIEGSNTRIRA